MRRLYLLALALVVLACSIPPLSPASPKCGPVYEIEAMPVKVCDAEDGSKILYLAPWWPVRDGLTDSELKDFRRALDLVDANTATARQCADTGDLKCAANQMYQAGGLIEHVIPGILCERPK